MTCADCTQPVCLGMDCKLAQADIDRVMAKYPALRPFNTVPIVNLKETDKPRQTNGAGLNASLPSVASSPKSMLEECP